MAKTVYVRKSGSDASDGLTEGAAKLTIAGANAIAVATDTVDIGAGVFTETAELGKISNCTYRGAGMFRTTIVGCLGYITFAYESHIFLIKDLRINWTNGVMSSSGYCTNGGYMQMTNVQNEFSTVTSASISTFLQLAPNATLGFFKNCTFANWGCFVNFLVNGIGAASVFRAYNCVFYRNGAGAGSLTPAVYYNYSSSGAYAVVKNCIFDQCAPQLYYLAGGMFDPANALNVHTHNLYHSIYTDENFAAYLDATEIYPSPPTGADPLFQDAPGGDFRLQDSSPAIGVGTNNLP